MFRLPDFGACLEAKTLFAKMGVARLAPLPEIAFPNAPAPGDERVQRDLKGGSVSLAAHSLAIDEAGCVTCAGLRCAIYIKRQRPPYTDVEKGTSSYKYHLCNCKTIEEMTAKGDGRRYAATARDDGRFPVIVSEGAGQGERLLTLALCRNCVETLTAAGMYEQPFSLKEFFRRHQNLVLAGDGRPGAPTPEEKAQAYKNAAGCVCQHCGVDCAGEPQCLALYIGARPPASAHGHYVLCVSCLIEHGLAEAAGLEARLASARRLQREQGIARLY